MITDTAASSFSDRPSVDIGPLSWVIGEVRDTLAQSRTALDTAVGQDIEAQITSLRHAKTYLHQAYGALQMIDLDGVVIIPETAEDVLDRLIAEEFSLTPECVATLHNGNQALVEYLEELLSGAPHQPVRLFPYYEALLRVRGAERIHPADLFFPDLTVRPRLPERAAAPIPDYAALRLRFEKALLPFLTNPDVAEGAAGARVLAKIIAQVERSQNAQQTRAFWRVMQGFAEAVAQREIAGERYVKQLFARINLQLRRLTQGTGGIAERLLRDALFFLARAENPSPQTLQLRREYRLDGLVPQNFEVRRYGQIDIDALVRSKEKLSHLKNSWNRIAAGDVAAANVFERDMADLIEAGSKLNSPPLSKLLRELGGIARHAAAARPGDQLGLEIATSMLFVENALNDISHLPDDFAQRADALSARLLAVVAGDEPTESVQWLNDMSREAQQRQTMSVLSSELSNSLRQVEKNLDEYFTNPDKPELLAPVDAMLHQIEGALAVLDQEEARLAVQHTRAAVQEFATHDAENPVPPQDCQRVAQNVGALSFFLETLQLRADNGGRRFSFDQTEGIFRANLLDKNRLEAPSAQTPDTFEVEAAPNLEVEQPEPATVEQELSQHQRQSADLALSLAVEPQNSALQQQLKESLQQVRDDATLIDNPEANSRAQSAIDLLENPDFAQSAGSWSDIVSATSVQQPAQPRIAASATPASNEAIDAELLDIFLTEAEEVLQCIRETIPESRHEPHNQAHLTTLRRSFHTLKGSSRMVGLMLFGDAAWSIEQVLNLWLSDGRKGTSDVYALFEYAATVMEAWVAKIQQNGGAEESPQSLIDLANQVRDGGKFVAPADAVVVKPVMDADGPHFAEIATELIVATAQSEDLTTVDAAKNSAGIETTDSIVQAEVGADGPTIQADANGSEFGLDMAEPNPVTDTTAQSDPEPEQQQRVQDDTEKDGAGVGFEMDAQAEFANESLATDADIPAAVQQAEEVQLSEADLLLFGEAPAQHNVSPASVQSSTAADVADLIAAPTDAELSDLQAESAIQIEAPESIDSPAVGAVVARVDAEVVAFTGGPASRAAHADDTKCIGQLEISLPLYTIYLAETDELARLLATDFSEWRHERSREVAVESVHAAHSLGGSSATVGFVVLHDIAHALERVLMYLSRHPVVLTEHQFDDLDQCVVRMKRMLQQFALGEMPNAEPAQVSLLEQMLAAVTARSEQEWEADQTGAPNMDPAVEAEAESRTSSGASEEASSGANGEANYEANLSTASDPAVASLAEAPIALSPAGVDTPGVASGILPDGLKLESQPSPVRAHDDHSVAMRDDLDTDLLPIFVEEGRDLFPQLGQSLRLWQQAPGQTAAAQPMLRILHTLKGSARMAGAMRLGQHLHGMESYVEHLMRGAAPTSADLEQLMAHHDAGLQLFEALQNPQAVADPAAYAGANAGIESNVVDPAQPVELPVLMPIVQRGFGAPVGAAATAVQAAASAAPLVRVRADILDRLVNQAGEVSISRSRIETEVGSLQQSLSELTENVSRLRSQLREIEMQAETQMASQLTQSGDREFDPLEFDRFTRLQELTRMMAESVNDVASVQQNLTRTVDGANDGLLLQRRLTRELQQDLMRVRMVQFASISERLYRVTRQASKDVDKRVNLEILGAGVEIDRSVLEKMIGPFEHLLRNAIAHGIETRDARRAAGKPETGELRVEIRQEGNEVMIQFSDDGHGLNLTRIREKAQLAGLITDQRELSESEVTDLIFSPGFSTAETVTELAGRGIGMDVVRSEAASLGGRIEVRSEPDRGAQFTIHLPLTLAVTQVVLLATGGKTYAVPSVLVEQVQQLKANALATAYNDGAVLWQGARVPLYYLASLLGEADTTPVAQQYSPLVILRSGGERVAIHVDEIVGNREVVVKNIGPQLARLIGIAGATVLGSGEIVMILNPVPLALRAIQESLRAPRSPVQHSAAAYGAIAEMEPVAAPVAGLRTQKIVMVVDDSLTVRRVTQRLLSREGFQVVLAKDGVDALQQLQAITPDVMLVDIEMPRMDGFDLTRNVRGDSRTQHIPIIMITSRTAIKHRNYALELGVNEYLGKPYREEDLLGAINGFVRAQLTVG